MSNWGKLCEAIKTYTMRPEHCPFRKESCFEDHFSEYLRYIFGWEYKEVKRQENIKFGHDNKRSDLTLHFEGYPTIVFELKAFGQPLAGEEIQQFFSYMKQLPTKFGILTNSVALELYYRPLDKRGERGEPKRILRLRFDDNNSEGIRLGKLLTRKGYDEQSLSEFCDELIQRQHEIEPYPCRYDSMNPIMSEQMTKDLDDKILGMIPLYQKWLNDTEEERKYVERYNDGFKWVCKNVFTVPERKPFTDADFVALMHQIPDYLTNVKNGAHRTLYIGLKGKRKAFVKAIKLINQAPQSERFDLLQTLLYSPDYEIKGVRGAFWSEIIRCKFPDVPLVNKKTLDFFIAIGLNIGVTPKEHVRNISYCYSRWRELYKKMNGGDIGFFELSHMEHFAKVSEEGARYMKDNFGSVVGDYTL